MYTALQWGHLAGRALVPYVRPILGLWIWNGPTLGKNPNHLSPGFPKIWAFCFFKHFYAIDFVPLDVCTIEFQLQRKLFLPVQAQGCWRPFQTYCSPLLSLWVDNMLTLVTKSFHFTFVIVLTLCIPKENILVVIVNAYK